MRRWSQPRGLKRCLTAGLLIGLGFCEWGTPSLGPIRGLLPAADRLDPTTFSPEEIRELQRQLGLTTVMVTHDQEEAMAISDRIAVMDRGQAVQQGTAHDLYYRPVSEFVARFIGRANLVDGKVLSAGEVEIEGVRVALATGRAAGQSVRLVIRPEMIEIAVAGGPGRIARRTTPAIRHSDFSLASR